MRRLLLGVTALLMIVPRTSTAQGPTPTPAQDAVAVAGNPKDECAASGVLAISLVSRKVTVIPQSLVVTYPPAGSTKTEICFAWFVTDGKKSDDIEKLELEKFSNEVLDAGGNPVLVASKKFAKEGDLISLKIVAEPKWEYGGQPVTERSESYSGTVKFKKDTEPLEFDPEIIIKKGG